MPFRSLFIILPILALTLVIVPYVDSRNGAHVDATSLLKVFPSEKLRLPQMSFEPIIEGPTVLISPLRSCSRSNNSDPFDCTSLHPYGYPNVSKLSDPTPSSRQYFGHSPGNPQVGYIFALFLTILYCLLFVATCIWNQKRIIKVASFLMGLGAFSTVFICVTMMKFWAAHTCYSFNVNISLQKGDLLSYYADLSNGFTLFFLGITLLGLMVFLSFFEIYRKGNPGVGKDLPSKSRDPNIHAGNGSQHISEDEEEDTDQTGNGNQRTNADSNSDIDNNQGNGDPDSRIVDGDTGLIMITNEEAA